MRIVVINNFLTASSTGKTVTAYEMKLVAPVPSPFFY
jgi:hypothetical protein